MKLLLHACCGPCSLEPVRLLQERHIIPTIFYSNPNIHPREEYEHRLSTLKEWAQSEDITVTEDSYDKDQWEACAGAIGEAALAEALASLDKAAAADQGLSFEQAASVAVDPGMRQARCRACYRLRFEALARQAQEQGFDTLGTTLSVSPYQYTDIIREELQRAADRASLQALFEDYRPYYPEATQRSRDVGMYRQNFCGCRFSQLEAEAERIMRKDAREKAKALKAAQNAERLRIAQEQQKQRRQEKAEYAQKQAKKHALLKALREKQKEEPCENQ